MALSQRVSSRKIGSSSWAKKWRIAHPVRLAGDTVAPMKPRRPNPYNDLALDALYTVAQKTTRDLAEVRTRTPVERAELAARCRHVLLAISARIAPGTHTPNQPENRLQPHQMMDSFLQWIAHQTQRDSRPEHVNAVRRLAMCRAADFAGIVGEMEVRRYIPDDAHLDAGQTREVLERLQAVAEQSSMSAHGKIMSTQS